VLTNAIDGPAANLARGVVQLVQRARQHIEGTLLPAGDQAAPARRKPSTGLADLRAPGACWTSPWSVDGYWGWTQTLWAPLESADRLEVVGDGRLRIAAGPGGGRVGEFVTRQVTSGEVQQLRYGGASLRPFPVPSRQRT